MRTGIVGGVLLAAGLVAVLFGVLPASDAATLAARVAPILVFVVAMTLVTELAAEADLFGYLAERAARWAGGRAWVLWLLTLILSVLSTVFLSLDTTAVLLTPVIVLLARHAGLPPLPFALLTVWMANTASLLLPVSNLTNLLAEQVLPGYTPLAFAALMAAPALVAILIPAAVLAYLHRRELTRRFIPAEPAPIQDRVLFIAAAITIAVLLPLLVSGLPVWIPALACACVLVGFFAVRRPGVLTGRLVPWSLVLFAGGLFLVVETAHALGLGEFLAAASGTGHDPLSLLRLAGVGAFGANAINNLPAYLALEPTAGDPVRIAALLIGVNVGPLITPWASLATLLWHRRLVSLNVQLSWRRYCALGLLVAPVTVAAATVALVTTLG
ncbi:MAG TPA: SLC13 family permease [Terrimesophilobacter sp.]|jgi:Na+/H+ antiporter NhaD and related arsenite permeases|uniref:SLC13 family permease n=1 Tax=Terrimesophilobacter sp. TaxID=2906435 RepID=UPI002F949C81